MLVSRVRDSQANRGLGILPPTLVGWRRRRRRRRSSGACGPLAAALRYAASLPCIAFGERRAVARRSERGRWRLVDSFSAATSRERSRSRSDAGEARRVALAERRGGLQGPTRPSPPASSGEARRGPEVVSRVVIRRRITDSGYYRPSNRGARFCAHAATPSATSALRNSFSCSSRSRRSASSMPPELE